MTSILAWITTRFSDWVSGLPNLTGPYQADDVVPVVRNGIPYHASIPGIGSVSPWRTPQYFGAKSDIQVFAGGATWSASGGTFTPGNSIQPKGSDRGKRLVVYGAGAGGVTYAGEITGVNGAAWTVTPALTQASGLLNIYGVKIATAQLGAGSYAPGDTITLTGGTVTGGSQPVLTVKYTKVVGVTLVSAGAGGTTGTHTVTGTTGRGTYFKATVTIAGGIITGISGLVAEGPTTGGAYFENPTNLAVEPVTGAGLTGAEVALVMGVAQVIPTAPGGYSSVPANPVAQGATSGSGTGATFTLQTTTINGGYGHWYYGTDDGDALIAAAAWATANRGTIRFGPMQWCGTSQTIELNGNDTTWIGDSIGSTEGNKTVAQTPYNSSIFWLGAAGEPIFLIATPDGAPRILYNSVSNLSLIGGNRAGYAIRFKSAYGGNFGGLYTEQFTNAAIELTTNTNASPPTDTQQMVIHESYLNQEGCNGVDIRLTGDRSGAGVGDASLAVFTNVVGWMGNDTGVELLYADSCIFSNIGFFLPSFSGALYGWEFGGIDPPGFYTYGHRIENPHRTTVVVRGTTSSGTSEASTRNYMSFIGDAFTVNPLLEPGAQLEYLSPLLENNKILVNKIISGAAFGGTLYNNRDILDGTDAGIISTSIALFGGGTRALYYNVVFDASIGFTYIGTGPAFALRSDNVDTFALYGAVSGTAGNLASLGTLWYSHLTEGTTVGNSLTVTGAFPGTTQGLRVYSDVTLAAAARFLGYNIYYDTVAGFSYVVNGFGWVLRSDVSGVIQLSAAPSGLAGAAATVTAQVEWTQGGGMKLGNATQGDLGASTINAAGVIASDIGLRIRPHAAPAAPATGWTLYVDSGDGNKLKAIASTGTVALLGTP